MSENKKQFGWIKRLFWSKKRRYQEEYLKAIRASKETKKEITEEIIGVTPKEEPKTPKTEPIVVELPKTTTFTEYMTKPVTPSALPTDEKTPVPTTGTIITKTATATITKSVTPSTATVTDRKTTTPSYGTIYGSAYGSSYSGSSYYKRYDDSNIGKCPKDLSLYHRIYLIEDSIYVEIGTAMKFGVGQESLVYLIEHKPHSIAVLKITEEEAEQLRTVTNNIVLEYTHLNTKVRALQQETGEFMSFNELSRETINGLKRMVSAEDRFGIEDKDPKFRIQSSDRRYPSYRDRDTWTTKTITTTADKKTPDKPIFKDETRTDTTKPAEKPKAPEIRESFFSRLRNRPLDKLSKGDLQNLDTALDTITATNNDQKKEPVTALTVTEPTDTKNEGPVVRELKP